jgi:hypothetical protein
MLFACCNDSVLEIPTYFNNFAWVCFPGANTEYLNTDLYLVRQQYRPLPLIMSHVLTPCFCLLMKTPVTCKTALLKQ